MATHKQHMATLRNAGTELDRLRAELERVEMLTSDERMRIWNEAHNQGLREASDAAIKVERRLAEEVKAGQTHYAWSAGANAVVHAIEMLRAKPVEECNGHGRCSCSYAGCEHDKAGPCFCRWCKLDRADR